MFNRRKLFTPGMTVGLFGGSFDPPHKGHSLVSAKLKAALSLDVVWWLVAPQNPLKTRSPDSMENRLNACRELVGSFNNRVYISDEETRLGTRNTVDTVRKLKQIYPQVKFIWLMGADNMASLHHWKDWQVLMHDIPMAIYPRSGYVVKAGLSPAAQQFGNYRIASDQAANLKTIDAPAWVLLTGKMDDISSTTLRNKTS
ncbi:MAG: nicotinate-nucleotide adenylyltransferase [Pseudomonadota bacterium]|nr:nicotinate-nucleotide adenylyltransferase [Pseudomonadota bacterium]